MLGGYGRGGITGCVGCLGCVGGLGCGLCGLGVGGGSVWGEVEEVGWGEEGGLAAGCGGRLGGREGGGGGRRGAQVRAHAVFALVVLGRDAISLLDRTAHLRRGASRMHCIHAGAWARARAGRIQDAGWGQPPSYSRYTLQVATRAVASVRGLSVWAGQQVGSRQACLQRGA